MMLNFGDLDGGFEFFAVVTPDGRIPTFEDDATLNEPGGWYTSPIGTLAHLSDYALVFSDREDAESDFEHYRHNLPEGTRIRTFRVKVEEIDNSNNEEPIEAIPS